MSLWSRLWHRLSTSSALAGAHALEEQGNFAAAAVEYEREGLLEEAIRTLLISVDADPDPSGRVRTLARILRLANQLGEVPPELRARYALTRLDVLRPTVGATASIWELSSLARELEELEQFEAAAEAFGLAGDRDQQVRLLVAAGKIEDLEQLISSENQRTRSGRIRSEFFAEVSALESSGQRAEALRRTRTFADLNPADEEVQTLKRSLQERLVRPPILHLDLEGSAARYVLLPEVTIGRTGATLEIPSPLLSRRHLLLHAHNGVPTLEDLQTRNGTFLAGARLAAPLPIRSPLSLSLGGEIPCQIEPWNDQGLRLSLSGETYLLPLSSNTIVGPWRLDISKNSEYFRIVAEEGQQSPILHELLSATDGIDLCFGDIIFKERGGSAILRVLP